MSSLSTLPKGDSAWLLRKAVERIMQQVSVLETNIGSSTTGNSANTQIIFNDAGTLRGDPDLIFSTALNRLVALNLESTAALLVGGSATITGDLTVDTSTLKVDSSNDRVGIGTATPAAKLIVRDGSNRNLLVSSDATQLGSAGVAIGSFTDNAAGYAPLSIIAGTSIGFGINGSTAMTLNSTGLGVGVSPSVRLHALTTSLIGARIESTSVSNSSLIDFKDASTTSTAKVMVGSKGDSLQLYSGGNVSATLDSSSNVGIGVTPSAWGPSGQINVSGNSGLFSKSNGSYVGSNVYYNGAWRYASAGFASYYYQSNGNHQWWKADSGANVGDVLINHTQAMTLDASGRLLLGTTTTSNAVDIGMVMDKSSGSGFVGNVYRMGGVDKAFAYIASAASAFRVDTVAGYTINMVSATNGVYLANGGTSWLTISDERNKDIIEPISNAVAKVGSLRSVIGKFKSETEGTRRSFLIAQDVQAVLPEAVDSTNPNELAVSYTDVIPLLVAAIKELTARVQTLEAK